MAGGSDSEGERDPQREDARDEDDDAHPQEDPCQQRATSDQEAPEDTGDAEGDEHPRPCYTVGLVVPVGREHEEDDTEYHHSESARAETDLDGGKLRVADGGHF